MGFEHILALILGNSALIIPLFLWNRSESRADIRHMDAKFDAYRVETIQMIKAIQDEIKDFHSRLCRIEEKKGK